MKHTVNVRQMERGVDYLQCRILKTYETTVTPQVGMDIMIDDMLITIRRLIISEVGYAPQEGDDMLQIDLMVNVPLQVIVN